MLVSPHICNSAISYALSVTPCATTPTHTSKHGSSCQWKHIPTCTCKLKGKVTFFHLKNEQKKPQIYSKFQTTELTIFLATNMDNKSDFADLKVLYQNYFQTFDLLRYALNKISCKITYSWCMMATYPLLAYKRQVWNGAVKVLSLRWRFTKH